MNKVFLIFFLMDIFIDDHPGLTLSLSPPPFNLLQREVMRGRRKG
jgi:hypothetical protein